MSQELVDAVTQDLTDRVSWENRQRVFYQMRHNGLRRKHKPGPWAADMHFPLADMVVEKLKPFYYDQLFAGERVATFTSLIDQRPELTEQTPYWFDYKLKQQSNFMTEILYGIDHMLTGCRGLLKMRWNPESRRVVYDSLDPLMVIVPQDTNELKHTPRACLVIQMSEAAYRQSEELNQDPEFIRRIKGKQDRPGEEKWNEKTWREGLTTGTDENQILLWEIWERDRENAWSFTTVSPMLPDEPARPKTGLPYHHGRIPVFELPREIKDKGYYAPRGEVEKVAPFEAALCKMWNEKLDSMTFYNNPLFSPKAGAQIPSGIQNLRLSPGKVAPFQLERVQMGSPPISYDQEMIQTRALAEQHVQLPDLGLASGSGRMDGEKKTATEVQQISQLTGLSVTMRARVFRLYLAEILQAHYRLLLQYDKDSLTYYYAGTVGALPQEALHENYLIEVDGNPDSWNKTLREARSRQRLEKYRQDPYINQVELRKIDLEEDDPRLVKRLIQDPNDAAADEAEDEAKEVPALLEGYPIRVKPHQNHHVRAEVLFGKMQQMAMTRTHEDPIALANMQKHFQEHIAAWKQTDSKGANAYLKEKQQALQEMSGGPQSGFVESSGIGV